MSALTKLFVILLIVCSMLLTAGVVVFVNRTEDFRMSLTQEQSRARTLQSEKESAEILARAAQNREQANAVESNRKIAERDQMIISLNEKIGAGATAGNTAQTTIAIQQAQLTDASSALKTLNQTLNDLQAKHDAMIKQHGETLIRNADLVGANTDLQKRIEQAEREVRWQNEQIVQLKAERDRIVRLLGDQGVDPNAAPVRGGVRPTPRVNGVVRQIRGEGGITVATISLGAADRIDKGMQFNIVDPNSTTFLGKITIDSVEANESIGRVEGPRVADIQPNQSRVVPQ